MHQIVFVYNYLIIIQEEQRFFMILAFSCFTIRLVTNLQINKGWEIKFIDKLIKPPNLSRFLFTASLIINTIFLANLITYLIALASNSGNASATSSSVIRLLSDAIRCMFWRRQYNTAIFNGRYYVVGCIHCSMSATSPLLVFKPKQ